LRGRRLAAQGQQKVRSFRFLWRIMTDHFRPWLLSNSGSGVKLSVYFRRCSLHIRTRIADEVASVGHQDRYERMCVESPIRRKQSVEVGI